MARYGQEFKDRAVARLLPPESAALKDVANELGVGLATLERWRSDALAQPSRERVWTAAARFNAVLTTAAMDEASKSAWCRSNGVYPQDLASWRDAATAALDGTEVPRTGAQEAKQHRRKVKELEREIARKDTHAVKPVLHGDNGATLKATTVLAMLHYLGVKPSYSRPRVSDDNAYAEALFRTAKYRPEFPTSGFADVDAARTWGARFTHWYNVEHKHSAIRYVSPAQRHAGDDHAILSARHVVYAAARERHPARWSSCTRDWSAIGPVTLNPERDSIVQLAANEENRKKKAA